MSVLGKKWVIKNKNTDKSVFEKLLENREFKGIFDLEEFYDPFLFEDMEISVKRIADAIEKKERIIIFGDYDVDGITAAAIMIHVLRQLNANVSYRLPHRVDDGYGLSEKFIDEFIEKKINLLITVDCGISCYKEIKKAKVNNIDVIITDHHTIPEKHPSDAFSIIHPGFNNTKYPFSGLTGAGVALKFAHALIKRFFDEENQEKELNALLDLATLGTIADLGPLIDENRLIVKRGLKSLSNTRWSGLKRLKELANIKEGEEIDSMKIGFQIAPRINAAGRIGNPYIALQLLLQEEFNEKTEKFGSSLENLNRKRQNMTEKALEEVENDLANDEREEIIIAHNENWHVGIIGLIAGKLAEKYNKPAIIMQDMGDILVASARSPEYFNIVDAITNCKDLLISFGGHAQAAGFNLFKKNLEEFKSKIGNYSKEKLKNIRTESILEIDCALKDEEITMELDEQIEKLSPFGIKNSKPTFLIENVEPYFIDQIGKDGNHLKFTININNQPLKVVAFRFGKFREYLNEKKKIDLVCNLEKNSWKGKKNLELHALDFRIVE